MAFVHNQKRLKGSSYISFYSLPAVKQFGIFMRSHYVKRFLYLSQMSAFLILLVGVLGLSGWIFRVPQLTSFFSSMQYMKSNAAILFIFSGLSLLFSHFYPHKPVMRFLHDVCALVVIALSSLTLSEYIFHINLGIDEFFFSERGQGFGNYFPNRIAPNGALIFLLTGLGLLLLDRRIRERWMTQNFTLLALLVLSPTLIGYLYGINFIYGFASTTKIDLSTTVTFIFLIAGILLARPKQGFVSILTDDTAGGFLARRLLLTTAVLPVLLGWVILSGQRAGLYDVQFRFVLIIASCIIAFTFLIWRNARDIHRLDMQRIFNEQKMLFLAEASRIFSSSLDSRTMLKSVAELSVPFLGDWCCIDLLDNNDILFPIVSAHKDHDKTTWARELWRSQSINLKAKSGIGVVLRTGKSVLYPKVTQQIAYDVISSRKEEELLKSLGVLSIIIVPIKRDKQLVGTIRLVSAESGITYTKADLIMAEELGARASLALENTYLYKSAQEAIQLRDEFISAASHELKTPLTSLKVYLQIIGKKSSGSDEKTPSYIARMGTQIDKLTRLIYDLLDVSKIQVGKLPINKEPFDFDELLVEIVDNLQMTSNTHRIIIDGKGGRLVLGDRDRIGQVVINLLTNAIKYSPEADHVMVHVLKNKRKVIVTVEDFGIGIDKKHLRKIFDRFYQVRGSDEKTFPGLGMGLYISYEIIRRHGSWLEVQSNEGKGSTFRFELSIAKKGRDNNSTNEI